MQELSILNMTHDHIEQVLAIEEACFSAPWTIGAFESELRDNPYAMYLVAVNEGKVRGYAGTWLVLDESHVTNIAVALDWQRRGVARLLMERLILTSHNQGARRMTLEVRQSNAAAQALYRSLGFRDAGIRPGYYTDNREDAVIMWLDDIAAALTGKEEHNG